MSGEGKQCWSLSADFLMHIEICSADLISWWQTFAPSIPVPPVVQLWPALRNEDGTMRRKAKTEYPTTLPIFRPWLEEKNLWHSNSGWLNYNLHTKTESKNNVWIKSGTKSVFSLNWEKWRKVFGLYRSSVALSHLSLLLSVSQLSYRL